MSYVCWDNTLLFSRDPLIFSRFFQDYCNALQGTDAKKFKLYLKVSKSNPTFPYVFQSKTEHFKKSFHYSALDFLNDIPSAIQELSTMNGFKQQLISS